MYGEGGLGYSILRLMVYPNESDWNADVEVAKAAQANGAIVLHVRGTVLMLSPSKSR